MPASQALAFAFGALTGWLIEALCPESCRICGAASHCFPGGEGKGRAVRQYETVCCLCSQLLGAGGTAAALALPCQDGGLLPVYCAMTYGPHLRKLVLRLKYNGDRLIARDLGSMLSRAFALFARDYRPECFVVVPVPLSRRRLAHRRFNQAELIAESLARQAGLRVDSRVIVRVRETRPQFGLSRLERRDNLRGAFQVDGARLAGRNVLVVDDILTTGSTLAEAACALRSAGSPLVVALTVARAGPLAGSRLASAGG